MTNHSEKGRNIVGFKGFKIVSLYGETEGYESDDDQEDAHGGRGGLVFQRRRRRRQQPQARRRPRGPAADGIPPEGGVSGRGAGKLGYATRNSFLKETI